MRPRGPRMSSFITICLAAALLLGAAPSGYAALQLTLDGRHVEIEPAVALLGGKLGLSEPVIVQALGGSVETLRGGRVRLVIGERSAVVTRDQISAQVDGRSVELDTAPRKVDGVLMIPLHLVADMAGVDVHWNLPAATLSLSRPVAPAYESAGSARSRSTRESRQESSAASEGLSEGEAERSARESIPRETPQRMPQATSQAIPQETSRTMPQATPEATPKAEDPPRPAQDLDPPQAELGAIAIPRVVRKVVAPPEAERLPQVAEVADPVRPDLPEEPSSRLPDPAISDIAAQRVVMSTDGGRSRVDILTDAPVEHSAYLLENPARLVLDLAGAQWMGEQGVVPGDGVVVDQVRVRQADDDLMRVVLDLAGPTGYQLQPIAGDAEYGMTVWLNHRVENIALEQQDAELDLFLRTSSGPIPYEMSHLTDPERLVIDLADTTLAQVEPHLAWNDELVQDVRISQSSPNTVRLVLELRDALQPVPRDKQELAESGISLHFAYPLRSVGTVSIPGGTGLLLEGSGPLQPEVVRLTDPERLVIDLPGTIPVQGLAPLLLEDGPVDRVRVGEVSPGRTRVVLDVSEAVEYSTYASSEGSRTVVALRSPSLSGTTIVVDPGHGGTDPGAVGPSGVMEKDVVLDVSLRLARALERAGARVIMTRYADYRVDNFQRARLANARNADAFVSVHANSCVGCSVQGTETYYNGRSAENELLAAAIQRELVSAVSLPDRGIKKGQWSVLSTADVPAVLVEVAFMNTPQGEEIVLDETFQQRAAEGIANGLLRFTAQHRDGRLAEVAPDRELAAILAPFLDDGRALADTRYLQPAGEDRQPDLAALIDMSRVRAEVGSTRNSGSPDHQDTEDVGGAEP